MVKIIILSSLQPPSFPTCTSLSSHYSLSAFSFPPSISPSLTDAADYSIRLVGGSREGVVEVAFNGRWGTICDFLWDSTDAEVACEELGLDTEDSYSNIPSGM